MKKNVYRFLLMFICSLIPTFIFHDLEPIFHYYFGVIIGGVCYILWPPEDK